MGSGTISFGIKADGTTWTWGYPGTAGGLGDNASTLRRSPVSVVGAHSFRQIVSSEQYCLALKSNGNIWGWGENLNGQLGDNTTTRKSSPVSLIGNHSFIFISAGSFSGGGLKADGSAWSWGQNTGGALGDNTTTNRSSPVSVVGAHSFIQISTGYNYVTALKSDGQVWVWGLTQFSSGNLGNNTINSYSSPVTIVGNHSFVFINTSGGGIFSLALKADGSCWSWGYNGFGRLGDNTTTDKSSPVSVVGNHSFIKVSAGGQHSLGLKLDGSVWAWGDNTQGQLGDNTTTSASSPVSVVGAHIFIDICAGNKHSFGIKSSGETWAWGDNLFYGGEIGDNQAGTNRSSPVSVVGAHNFIFLYSEASNRRGKAQH